MEVLEDEKVLTQNHEIQSVQAPASSNTRHPGYIFLGWFNKCCNALICARESKPRF